MKSKIKLTEKLLETLGIDIPKDQFKDNCIKRINYNEDISEVRPHDLDGYSQGIITSIDVDADGDVVMPRGLDLSRYEKNPVVLFNHSLAEPIGYAEKLIVNDDHIWAKTRYGTTEEARKIHQLVKDKVLRTHSIGFITTEATSRGEVGFDNLLNHLKLKYADKFDDATSKKVDRIITKALLIEYSIVTIPSNESAVINEIKEIKLKNLEIKETEQVEEVEDNSLHSEEVEEETLEEVVVTPEDIEVVEEEEEEVVVTETDSTIEDTEMEEEVIITTEEPELVMETKMNIRVLKRATSIKKVSSLEEQRAENLKSLYRSNWGC